MQSLSTAPHFSLSRLFFFLAGCQWCYTLMFPNLPLRCVYAEHTVHIASFLCGNVPVWFHTRMSNPPSKSSLSEDNSLSTSVSPVPRSSTCLVYQRGVLVRLPAIIGYDVVSSRSPPQVPRLDKLRYISDIYNPSTSRSQCYLVTVLIVMAPLEQSDRGIGNSDSLGSLRPQWVVT
jgi:hypothetical protein